ncbi:MAG: hypothetical protein FWC91_07655 [Defluviitaleaceae bacterium]|nr:hypothetical protein [Defluviitaleaceae bacterium]
MERTTLLDKFFQIGGNHELDKFDEIEIELRNYLKNNGADDQVRDALSIIKASRLDFKLKDFESCRLIATPVIERLSYADKWDFVDLRLLTGTIQYADSYKQFIMLVEEAFRELENHSHEEPYMRLKTSMCLNIMVRLIKAKHFGTDQIEPSDNLDGNFNKYLNIAITACNACKEAGSETYALIYHWAISIYRGIFHKDYSLVDDGLAFFRKHDNAALYKMMSDDVNEYKSHMKFDLAESIFNDIFAYNVKRERINRNYDMYEVSSALGITSYAYELIESGEKGPTSFNVFKLSEFYDVPISTFLQGIKPGSSSDASGENRSIDHLLLPDRIDFALKKNNIKTIADVLKLNFTELSAIPTLGNKAFIELLRKMRMAGYTNWTHDMEESFLKI